MQAYSSSLSYSTVHTLSRSLSVGRCRVTYIAAILQLMFVMQFVCKQGNDVWDFDIYQHILLELLMDAQIVLHHLYVPNMVGMLPLFANLLFFYRQHIHHTVEGKHYLNVCMLSNRNINQRFHVHNIAICKMQQSIHF